MFDIVHILHPAFSGICWHSHSSLLRHFQAYWDIKAYSCLFIQPNSAPCITLAYLQTCHILSPGIFRTGSLLKTLWEFDQVYSELCHRTLFNHIQVLFRTLRNSSISRNLAYLESWNIQNSSIIAYRHIFRILPYWRKFRNMQNSDIFKTRQIFRILSKI